MHIRRLSTHEKQRSPSIISNFVLCHPYLIFVSLIAQNQPLWSTCLTCLTYYQIHQPFQLCYSGYTNKSLPLSLLFLCPWNILDHITHTLLDNRCVIYLTSYNVIYYYIHVLPMYSPLCGPLICSTDIYVIPLLTFIPWTRSMLL